MDLHSCGHRIHHVHPDPDDLTAGSPDTAYWSADYLTNRSTKYRIHLLIACDASLLPQKIFDISGLLINPSNQSRTVPSVVIELDRPIQSHV